MKTKNQINNNKLTSSEIGQLWLNYMGNAMSNCVVSYFEKIVQDSEVRNVVKKYKKELEKSIKDISSIFESGSIPIPKGFGDSDVNLDAKRLFTDTFILHYVKCITCFALLNLSVALPIALNKDVQKYFLNHIEGHANLAEDATNLLIKKELNMKHPYISLPNDVEFVDSKKYSSGFVQDLLGNERLLNTLEVCHAVNTINLNLLGSELLKGFIQVNNNKELLTFFEDGKKISDDQIEYFSSLLKKENLKYNINWGSEVLLSEEAPFSEKLMVFHIAILINFSIARYTISFANSMRTDISAHYSRLIAELVKYSKEGINIMIKNYWLEKVPEAKSDLFN